MIGVVVMVALVTISAALTALARSSTTCMSGNHEASRMAASFDRFQIMNRALGKAAP
jgi:uncharacterized protein with beta-barrel porin domain